MNPSPEFWIVAGPNGAGKTTCVQVEPIRSILPNVNFLNPDDETKQLLVDLGFTGFADAPNDILIRCFSEAATRVERELGEALRRGESMGVETVLSTHKYRPVVEWIREIGGIFNLIYITLASPAIATQRVAKRVSRGGHDVPAEKIAERFHRSHVNLTWYEANADHFWVIDNSGSNGNVPPILRAYGSHGKLDFLDPNSSEQLAAALRQLESRAE